MATISLSLLFAALVSTQLLQCSCAAPLWTPLDSEQGINPDGITSLDKEEGRQSLREVRSASRLGVLNNYSKTAFKLYINEWKHNNCMSEYNCGTVSQYWCNTTLQKKMFCSQDDCKL